jgi:hypothetical protein
MLLRANLFYAAIAFLDDSIHRCIVRTVHSPVLGAARPVSTLPISGLARYCLISEMFTDFEQLSYLDSSNTAPFKASALINRNRGCKAALCGTLIAAYLKFL